MGFLLIEKLGKRFVKESLSRCVMALVLMCVSVGTAYAQSYGFTLMVDGSMDVSACVDEPIVLNASATNPSASDAVDVYRSNNGSAWYPIGTAIKDGAGVYTYVDDMMSHTLYYQFVDQKNSAIKSNVVTVNVSTDCPGICHTTTTGEYYLGTDFNPEDGCNVNQIDFSNNHCLQNHFEVNGIAFEGCNAGHVQKGWKTTDRDAAAGVVGNNYYYVFHGGNCNNTPFILTFDRGKYLNKTFRFTMRLYLDVTNCGSFDSQAKMNFRTGFGNPVDLCVDGEFYDGVSGEHLKDYAFCANSQHLDQDFVLGSDVWRMKQQGHNIIRMEFVFYGLFKTQNQEKLTIYPEFQQWNNCAEIAVDYISGEAADVCMDHGAVCIGKSATINAAGFPRNAIYIWESWNDQANRWEPLRVGGFVQQGADKQSISIPVDFLGKRKFRVRSDDNHPLDKPIEFFVTGKNCDPVQPSEIKGPVNPFCVPNTKEDGKFEVFPMDANEKVKYTWSFETPSGQVFGSDRILFDGGTLDVSSRGGTVYLLLNGDAEEGPYKVTVQPMMEYIGSDGGTYEKTAGSPISKIFDVYRTPQIQIIKEGTDPLHQAEVELCPTDHNQKVVAIADVKSGFQSIYQNKYVYTWYSGATGQRDEAIVDLPGKGACDGSYRQHSVSVEVEIDGVGCPNTASQEWNVGRVVAPTIDCDDIKDFDINLGAKEKTTKVTFTFPSFTSGCETDPQQKIEVNFTPVDGAPITKTFEGKKSEMDRMDKSINLPAGTGTVTYSVIDGCGNTASCSKNIKVRDVTPPNIDCSEIDDYTTKLTLQDGCDAATNHHATLPKLTAPVLTDKNGVDGSITGEYMGRAEGLASAPNTANPNLAQFNKGIDLNANYSVGVTYILWKFEDKSGNKMYCVQKIEVIDDRKPVVKCPDAALGNVSNLPGECGLSVKGLMDQMTEFPEAHDTCTVGTKLTPFVLYRNINDEDLTYVTEDNYDRIIFYVNETYEIVWRFYKLNDMNNVYEDCVQNFTVVDTEEPVFDCSSLHSVRVTANSYKPKNKGFEYLKYATKDNVIQGAGPGAIEYTGTLKDAFANGDIRIIDPSEVKDNCSTDIIVEIELEGPDETGKVVKKEITKLSDLEKHKFGIGMTTITYTFIDESNNESSCTQNIIVTAGTTPIPNCPPVSNIEVFADEKCEYVFNLNKEEIPTAKIPVNQEALWFNFRYSVIGGLHFKEDCALASEYFLGPKTLMDLNGMHQASVGGVKRDLTLDLLCEQVNADLDGFMGAANQVNKWNYWSTSAAGGAMPPMLGPGGMGPGAAEGESILSRNDKLTTVVDYEGYPFEVELRDSTGKSVKLVKNAYTADDIAPSRVLVPRYYGSTGTNTYECPDLKYGCTNASIKVKNNFSDLVMSQTLTKGNYQLIYRFQNEEGGEQVDSCVINISVVDTIAPKLECGDWNNTGTYYANGQCVVPVDTIAWFKMPTLADLKVTDNCTKDPSEFTITWSRKHGVITNTSASALTDPLLMGTTTMTWYVTDASGNTSQCQQTITVVDTTGPVFDCSTLMDINVETEAGCKASAESVIKAGLETPVAPDDVCSPTGAPIPAKGERSDGKGLFTDDYPRGTTVITWTFEDALGNKTVCTQNVIVSDSTAPVFDDCDKLPEVVIELAADQCTASKDLVEANLGTHTAVDDCDGEIPGVPHVMLPNGVDYVPLYAEFKKDTTYKVVWVFTDATGNITECYQKLTIADTTAPDPSGVCPPPTKTVTAHTVCSVEYDELGLPTLEEMKITDLCDGDLYPTVVAKVYAPDGTYKVYYDDDVKSVTYPVGTHTFLWIYEDKAGNKDTCTMLLTVDDDIPPVLEDCDVDPKIDLTVDGDICAMDPANVKTYIREPKAYDECDDYTNGAGLTWMTPIVERYFIDSTFIINASGDTTGIAYDTTQIADGITHMWDEDVFPKGLTLLKWIFTDSKGNSVFCEKTVTVHDYTAPYFNCDDIDPDTLRPEAYVGDCEVEFGNLKRDVLDKLAYKAWDACAGDSIPGVLTLNGTMELPDEYTMQVGITYKLLWLFQDEDGNKTTCPQYILPSHLNPVNFDCETIKDTVVVAAEGTCAISSDSLKLPIPVALDSCAVLSGFGGEFEAVGVRSDSLPMSADFPTGHTTVNWMFVSPWNLHDTLWCDQDVFVRGNKRFDLDCDVLTPTRKDTLEDCGPTDPLTFVIDTPRVADPCIVDTEDPEYWRVGVGTRSDSKELTDPYPLGTTSIEWLFTDFTNTVTDTCHQDVVVRTNLEMIFNCDSLNHDTIKVEVATGECTVDASKVKDKIVTPFALHPCPEQSGMDTIWGVPSRKFGMSMDSSFYVGLSEIVWTFVDTTSTLIKDTMTCSQWVQVGDVNEMPVNCENYPDLVYRLSPDDCEISWKEMEIKVPGVVDLCSHKIIDPVVTRSSGKSLTAVTTVADGDTVVTITADDFTVGVDTVTWSYSFQGQLFVCEQVITVKDSMAPIFDCESLTPIVVPSEEGKCFVNANAVFDSLPNPWPQAEEACTGDKIDGRVFLEDGTELTAESSYTISVGQHTLTWIFIDPVINEIGDTCEQSLVVMGDQAPIFDCESLKSDPILIEGCDTTLSEQTIPTPYALDACTKDSVEGVGTRMDGGELYGVYPVGTTTIRWVFTSPFSSLSDTCMQDVTILTKQLLDLHCLDVNKDTVSVDVEEGDCFAKVDLKTPFALHPCPDQSGVDTIMGVPYRSDNLAITDSFRTGIVVVTWVFTDTSGTMLKPIDTCYTVVKVGDVNKMPVDCSNMPDTTIVLSPEDCEISWDAINFKVPEVRDLCSDSLITPTLTRWSTKSMEENFTVGPDTVYWNYNFFGQVITCKQGILVLDSVAPSFDCSTLKDTTLVAKDGLCDVSAEEIEAFLGEHAAIDSCTGKEVPGRAYICDTYSPDNLDGCAPVNKVSAKVGDTLYVHWIFQDSLLNAVPKICDQTVVVKGTALPQFDCKTLKDTIVYLAVDECELTAGKLVLETPYATDSCTGVAYPGVPTRADGKEMTDIYPKGETVVEWTFTSPHSINSKSCSMKVIVKDSIAPDFDCKTLKDTIKVRITMNSVSDTEVSYDEVVEAGLETPSVDDACDGVLVALGSRSDGNALESNFSLGDPVVVTWTFRDSSGNEKQCSQVVVVEDWLLEELTCPDDLNGKVFACVEDVPAPYATYQEFKAAGGSFSNEAKMLENSFSFENRFEGDSCEMIYTRTYHVEDFRHNDITCQQVFKVKDTIAPEIKLKGDADDIMVSCTDTIPDAMAYSVSDNCDPSPKITISDKVLNRGTDPHACDYYNYDILRTYLAVDRCGNESKVEQRISVRDTTGPKFDLTGWRDTILAKNLKSCTFGAPNLELKVGDIVYDDCSEYDITIKQVPAPGTVLEHSSVVWIYAYDRCGNVDSISTFAKVQEPQNVVTMVTTDVDTCIIGDEKFPLSSNSVRFATGRVLIERYDGSIREIPSVFNYDYYRGTTMDEKNLMFSDNPLTYRSKFEQLVGNRYTSLEDALIDYTGLSKNIESGYYTFMAMDTMTGCSATATAYVNIAETPRVRIEGATLHECEGNMIDLNAHVLCEAAMGDSIRDSYWTLNGERFDFEDTLKGKLLYDYNLATLAYVAENRCGSTSSLNSLFLNCGDEINPTKADSIEYFGSAENLALYNKNRLYTHDSIVLDVHRRYAPDSLLVETEPHDPTRIWRGETVVLRLKTQYPFLNSAWYKVVGRYDREFYDITTATDDYYFGADSTRFELDDEEDVMLYTSSSKDSYVEDNPQDTTFYYVTIDDGVCPAAASSLIRVDVLTQLPTAFTPYVKDGLNDIFMERHPVTIFDRYGQKIFEGENGWNGTNKKGARVDPGVYYYSVVMIDGTVMKGTIEVVYLR